MATSTISVPSVATLNNASPVGTHLRAIATAAKADIEGLTAASLSDVAPVATGAAAVAGVAATASRSDHVHADPQRLAAGANLADADATIAVAAGLWRKVPSATLTANRAITLGTTGAAAGDQITVTRLGTEAYTLAFINGGAGAGTLHTLPASKVGFVKAQFDGSNWALREAGVGS
jgi:hypothetical protein